MHSDDWCTTLWELRCIWRHRLDFSGSLSGQSNVSRESGTENSKRIAALRGKGAPSARTEELDCRLAARLDMRLSASRA